LAELLLEKGYDVHGIVRRVALEDETHRLWRIRKIIKDVTLHPASLESYPSIIKVIQKISPNEVYHLGAQSYVSYSFEDEFSTLTSNINSTHYCLSAIRELKLDTKFYFAGSSEMFGKVKETPQTENTAFHPRSTYGISKVAGFELTRNYREAYNIHASTGILFNHESERRGFEFVTRKISYSAARIKLNLQKKLEIGNLNAKRDWGYAPEYVEAMWLMLQENKPDDYVVGTGKVYSVKQFAKKAFQVLDLNYEDFIKTNKKFFRPSEVELLCSNPRKIRKKIGWKSKLTIDQLVEKMVVSDYNLLKKG